MPSSVRKFQYVCIMLVLFSVASLLHLSTARAQGGDILHPSNVTPFLYLPFRGDWVLDMTSGFDHDYPDYNKDLPTRVQDQSYEKKILYHQATWDPVNPNKRDYAGSKFGCSPTSCPESSSSLVAYYWPIYEMYVWYDGHDGYDFGPDKADGSSGSAYDVLASASGTVLFAGWSCDEKYPSPSTYCSDQITVKRGGTTVTGPRREFYGFGYRMDIGHDINNDGQNEYMTRYAHLVANSNKYGKNQTVNAGAVIATIGTTGNSTGNHLHFGVYHRSGTAWHPTDPFGWDTVSLPDQRTPDPLVAYQGETSQNLWVGESPQWVNGTLGQLLGSVPPNTRPLGGNPDGTLEVVSPVVDTIAPSGYFTNPSAGSTIYSSHLSISANANDNAGGSGVREVRFSAKWNNQWRGIGVAYASPYGIDWDMCAAGVPDGDVELGLEVWDNANNKWVYSEHYTNPHVTKQVTCTNNPPGGTWEVDYWLNTFLAGYPNAHSTETSVYVFRDWQSGSPATGIGTSDWSARFTAVRYFQGGHYDFYANADDGARIRIDGESGDPNWWGSTVRGYDLSSGNHTVVIEYKQNSGSSRLQAWWKGPGALPVTVQDPNQWFAQYYPNRDLWGEAPLQLNEGGGFLTKQWDYGGPGSGLPNDNFSARFRRTIDFNCGTYQFNLFTDDGSRVKIDGNTIAQLDQWHDGVNYYTANVNILSGAHEITVEYYENGGSAGTQLNWSLLTPCKPDLSPLPVIPSSRQSTTSTATLYAGSRTFLDWHFTNGNAAVTSLFFVELWVDNQLIARYPYSSFSDGVNGGFDDWAETIGQSGWHTLKLITDPDNLISESNENNNVWEGQFYWQPIAGWKGEYFTNVEVNGNPWLTRDDAALDFDWQGGTPDPSLPADGFSARWTRDQYFASGVYEFHVFHDDGARLYIDGKLIFENWCGNCRQTDNVDITLLSGFHNIRMDMWENSGWAGARLTWDKLRDIKLIYLPMIMQTP